MSTVSTAVGAPTPTDAAAPTRYKPSLVDCGFALLTLATVVYFFRASRSFSFRTDDWALAARGNTFGDYFEPYNDHLATVHIAIYRVLYEVFGFGTYLPWRALSIGISAAIAVSMYALYRVRVGSGLAFLAGTVLLWYPELTVVATYFPLFLPLLAAIACAWMLPKSGRAYDVALGLVVTAALCTSGTGAPIAAGCLVYLALTCRSLWRWLAIVVPTAVWASWWLVQSERGSRSITEVADPVLTGIQESFAGLAFGNMEYGKVLTIGFVVLLAWRLRQGPRACANTLAWSVALVIWWFGVGFSRTGSISDTVRYEFVGTTFVLLACLPTTTTLPARSVLGRRLQGGVARRVAILAAVVAGILVVGENKPGIDERTDRAAREHASIRQGLIVVNQGRDVVPDGAAVFVGAFRPITGAAYRAAVSRYGTPAGTEPVDPDAALVRIGRLRPRGAEAEEMAATCEPLTAPVRVPPNARVVLRSGDDDVVVKVQRFSSASTPIGSIPARTAVVVSLRRLNGRTPWTIDASGACMDFGLTIQKPRDPTRARRNVTFSAQPHTPASIREVRFHLTDGRDDRDLGRAHSTLAGYTVEFDTTSIPNGWYELTAVATDPQGRRAVSAPVSVFVANR